MSQNQKQGVDEFDSTVEEPTRNFITPTPSKIRFSIIGVSILTSVVFGLFFLGKSNNFLVISQSNPPKSSISTSSPSVSTPKQLSVGDFYKNGTEKYKKSNYLDALEDYTQAIQIESNNSKKARNFYMRGNTYYMLQNYQLAIEDYNQAIQLKRDDCNCVYTSAYYWRGNAYEKLNDKEAAHADYQKAAKYKHRKAIEALRRIKSS